jgi:DNA polymerase (family 10)
MPIQTPTNADIADLLEQMADLLEQHEDNPHRVQAFRHGAKNVRACPTPLSDILRQEGGQALTRIEGIGQGLATIIFEFIQTGRSSYWQQLQARQSAEEIFSGVPGIGAKLAQRIVHYLGIASLEGLQQAARDGRLGTVEGFGPKRLAAVRHSLAGMLAHAPQQRQPAGGASGHNQDQPAVSLLLEVDAEYRRQAATSARLRYGQERPADPGDRDIP